MIEQNFKGPVGVVQNVPGSVAVVRTENTYPAEVFQLRAGIVRVISIFSRCDDGATVAILSELRDLLRRIPETSSKSWEIHETAQDGDIKVVIDGKEVWAKP